WAGIVIALLAATVWALARQPWLGFWGAWFFLILAPTSTVLPIADPAFEHRMYLPLASIAVVMVIGMVELLRISLGASVARRGLRHWLAAGIVAVAAVTLGYTTVRRNEDYRSELAMWSDIVAKRPDNARAQFSLGVTLSKLGKMGESLVPYSHAVQ